jgi:ribosome-binding protein aMBF1 (putative translation factor)
MNYGQMVQAARRKKEWTVKTLIERLNGEVSPAYITKVEIHGEIPTPSLTCKIAEVLDIDLMALVEAAKENKRRMFNELLERKWEEVTTKRLSRSV